MSRREGDDDYDNIIAQLGPAWRVIVCKDNWQWIVQERKDKWRSLHFCTSREGVIRRVKGKPGWEALATLHDRFQPTQRRGKASPRSQVDPESQIGTETGEADIGGG
jgi:hypothetical protein